MAKREEKLSESAMIGGLVWRSVEVELPDADLNVLILGPEMDGEPFIGYYDDNEQQWITVHGSRVPVTHWMELPTPPGSWFEQVECLTWSIAELLRSPQIRSRLDLDAAASDLRELAQQMDQMELQSGE